MTKVIIIISFLFSTSFVNANTATVIDLRGEVLFNGKKISPKDKLTENGVIEVKAKSYLKIKIEKYQSQITFAPGAKLKLKFQKNKKKSPYTLLSGSLRWVTTGKKALKKGVIKTRTAIFGVRGTDFLVSVNPLLNESEIICFDGEVLFINKKNTKDRKSITKNQWGGLGGRFGSSIGNVMTLPKNIINHFKSLIN